MLDTQGGPIWRNLDHIRMILNFDFVTNHTLIARVELTALAARMPIDALLEMFVFIDQLRQYLGMNLNPQLVFERLIVHMQQTIVASSSQ